LRALVNLKFLELRIARATDEGLVNLRGMNKLKRLDLNGSSDYTFSAGRQFSAKAFEHIGQLAQLEGLWINNIEIDEAVLSQLSEMTGLKSLILNWASITDEGEARLRKALPGTAIACIPSHSSF
jgi:hypothetical protein